MNFYKITLKTWLILIQMLLITNIICSQEYSLEYTTSTDDTSKEYKYKNYKTLVLSIEDSISIFKKNGYINSEVESFSKKDSFSYQVFINKNRKLKYLQVINRTELENDINLILENYLISKDLIKFEETEPLLNKISDLLSEKGYPFAKIKLKNNTLIDSVTVKSEIDINYGIKRYINEVVIKGYENFPKKYVKNIFQIKRSKALDIKKLKENANLINNLPFARNTRDPEILFKKDSTSIYLYVEKIKKNSFDGFIGFDTDENTGKINFQGYANVDLVNTFNKGEILNFNFRAENKEDKSLNSKIYIPYIFASPLNLKYEMNIIRKDSSYTSNESIVELDKIFGKIKTGIGFQKLTSNTELSLENIQDFESNLVNIFTEYEKYDFEDIFIPNKFKVLIRYGYGKKTQLNTKSRTEKYKIEIQKKFNLSKKIKVQSKLTNENINSKNLVNNELMRFGGVNSIRGFEDNSIFASSYTVLNSSLNYYLNDTIYIYTIFDVANYSNIVTNIEDNLYTGGFGFSTRTENGVISVNYSKGNSWGNPFNLKNAKISVNFITFF